MSDEPSSNGGYIPKIRRCEALPCTEAELFEVFGNPIRRQTLSYLYSTSRKVVSTDELVERCVDDDEVTIEDAEQLAVALHHLHLPKLDDAGFLDYHPDAEEVYGADEAVVDASVAEVTDVLFRVVE